MTQPNTATEESQADIDARRASGEFVRGVSGFRGAIGADDFPPEPNRYHLYVALNCPWCHRVTLARNVLGLADSITLNVAFPSRTDADDPSGENLWQFAPDKVPAYTGHPLPECTLDTASGHNFRLVKSLYEREGSDEKSVPVLFDKQSGRIVSNESAEIVRMLNTHAAALGSHLPEHARPDLYPAALASDIDALNTLIFNTINNGAYKAGFSSDQAVYAAAFEQYFDTLNTLENRLSDGRAFLMGDAFTEVDLRLYPTLYRHDPIYYVRMKLNGARVLDYPNLWRWLCRVYAIPGVPESNSLDHCKIGYFGRSWNGTIALGPILPMGYPEAYQHPALADDV
ncbi:MAG: glutathione S-transferase C-terminal domain-containing protein [Gammaproteobacteria bacterium]|nr:glutathione S-transferase C-terminal domain-containing protein [Gammaproteobacteria bacterium]